MECRMNGAEAARGLPWEGHVGREADREVLRAGERAGNVVAIAFIIFFVALLLYLQGRGYIFSEEFNELDAVLFYGSILFGIIPNVVRAVTARRNLGRLFDIMGSLIFIIVAAYFLTNFHFNFDNLYLILPDGIQDSFQWFNNAVFRILLEIAMVITALSVVYSSVMYVLVRNELRRRASAVRGQAL